MEKFLILVFLPPESSDKTQGQLRCTSQTKSLPIGLSDSTQAYTAALRSRKWSQAHIQLSTREFIPKGRWVNVHLPPCAGPLLLEFPANPSFCTYHYLPFLHI